MSFINYGELYKTTDIRIVKTRQALFSSIIQFMSEKELVSITITELCKYAMINRKTFYLHYKSIIEVFDDLEHHIIHSFIDILIERKVVTSQSFDPYSFILLLNSLVEENRKNFDIIFPYLKTGSCMRKIGAEVGKLAFRFMVERPGCYDIKVYPYSLVFTICGLITSYFDWIDFGMQFPVEELAAISKSAVTTPLNSILNSTSFYEKDA